MDPEKYLTKEEKEEKMSNYIKEARRAIEDNL